MSVAEIASETIRFVLRCLALLAGFLAALLSQVSATDYRRLFIVVFALTGLCVAYTIATFILNDPRRRVWLLLASAAGLLGCLELGFRLLGVRLLG